MQAIIILKCNDILYVCSITEDDASLAEEQNICPMEIWNGTRIGKWNGMRPYKWKYFYCAFWTDGIQCLADAGMHRK